MKTKKKILSNKLVVTFTPIPPHHRRISACNGALGWPLARQGCECMGEKPTNPRKRKQPFLYTLTQLLMGLEGYCYSSLKRGKRMPLWFLSSPSPSSSPPPLLFLLLLLLNLFYFTFFFLSLKQCFPVCIPDCC